MNSHSLSRLALVSCGILGFAACASNPEPSHVPAAYLTGTTLDRNEIGVRQTTEFLEVNFNPADSGLRQGEIAKIKGFLAAYNASGHGPLIMSLPRRSDSPQLAVSAAVEARQLAWEAGIEYEQISGAAYDANGRRGAPLILAYKAYTAVAPDCKSMTEYDVADAVSNNDLPSLGCSVRTNMAAIIADPADIFGTRPLDNIDPLRRSTQLEAWRNGEGTAATRDEAESGAISSVVE